MRVLLVASGGGHLHELLALAPWFEAHEHLILSNDTALSRSLAVGRPVVFVPDIAFGLRKHLSPITMVKRLVDHVRASARHMRAFKPDLVVSTGASLCVLPFIIAKLSGRPTVYIESVARIHAPSLTGKLVWRWVDHVFVQWPHLQTLWPRAQVSPTLKPSPAPRDKLNGHVFVSVGTALPFDRLIHAVSSMIDNGVITDPVVAQIGAGSATFTGISCHASLSHADMQAQYDRAHTVICHAGAGTILGALDAGCRVIVLPRLERYGEHYDDHQLEIAQCFADQGLITLAHDESDLARAFTAAQALPLRSVRLDMENIITSLRQISG